MKNPKTAYMIAGAMLALALIVSLGATDGYQPLRQAATPVNGLYVASPSTLSDGERDELRLTSAGLLRVVAESSTITGDTELPAAAALADNAANPTTTTVGAALLAYDGTTFDRVAIGNGVAAAALRVSLASDSTGALIANGGVAHDGADSGNPVKIGARAVSTLPAAMTANDRSDIFTDLYGRVRTISSQPLESWTEIHNPGANTQATASKAADAAARHVCKGVTFTFASLGAPTPEQLSIVVRDGATGAGTIKWTGIISLPAVAGEAKSVTVSDLYIVGTLNTAMTAEFSAAGGANDYQAVTLFGESIPQ